MQMISIKTQTGYWLDIEDSKLYIKHELRNRFSTYIEFYCNIIELENPSYWGDFSLEKSENDYKAWIKIIAKEILDK